MNLSMAGNRECITACSAFVFINFSTDNCVEEMFLVTRDHSTGHSFSGTCTGDKIPAGDKSLLPVVCTRWPRAATEHHGCGS